MLTLPPIFLPGQTPTKAKLNELLDIHAKDGTVNMEA